MLEKMCRTRFVEFGEFVFASMDLPPCSFFCSVCAGELLLG